MLYVIYVPECRLLKVVLKQAWPQVAIKHFNLKKNMYGSVEKSLTTERIRSLKLPTLKGQMQTNSQSLCRVSQVCCYKVTFKFILSDLIGFV